MLLNRTLEREVTQRQVFEIEKEKESEMLTRFKIAWMLFVSSDLGASSIYFIQRKEMKVKMELNPLYLSAIYVTIIYQESLPEL